jgi:hypothetical protein
MIDNYLNKKNRLTYTKSEIHNIEINVFILVYLMTHPAAQIIPGTAKKFIIKVNGSASLN